MRILILFLLGLGSLTLRAQDKMALDIDQAMKMAMEKNIQVISARNSYESALAGILPKKWGNNLPTIDFNANVNRTYPSRAQFVVGTDQSADPYNFWSYSLDANYLLFNGLNKWHDLKNAQYLSDAAEFDLQRTRQVVVLQVYDSYFAVLKNKELLKVSEDNLKRSTELLKQMDERYNLGAQILSDVYKQKVQVGSDKVALLQAKNNLNTSMATLNNVLGLKIDTPLELTPIKVDISIMKEVPELESALEEALNTRQDYRSAERSLKSAQAGKSMARSGYFPTISTFARYSWSNDQFPETYRVINDNDQWTFGLNFSIPIFNGFQRETNIVQAQQNINTSKATLESTKRQVALDIQIAILNLRTSYEQVQLSKENVASAKEDLRLATERYNLGAATILDQITANAALTQAQFDFVKANYDFLYAQQQHKLAMGKLTNM